MDSAAMDRDTADVLSEEEAFATNIEELSDTDLELLKAEKETAAKMTEEGRRQSDLRALGNRIVGERKVLGQYDNEDNEKTG